ncbi:MAG: DUF4339 domain-containing protein [Bdellovibrionaceae bacterium]|nr:DUF4339 domain-containing protein [Pseudobdellovibrionaceae bacterium]
MAKNYYVSKNNQQIGPFSEDVLLNKIKAKEISWMDYIYDDVKKDWVIIVEHKAFNKMFTESVLKHAVSDPTLNTVKTRTKDLSPVDSIKEKAWYVLKDNNNYGPFSQAEIIQMLQAKIIYEYDFLWQPDMESWKRLAEIPDFSRTNLKKLIQSGDPEISELFFRRRNVRVNYGCSLIVHNNKQIFKGRSLEISAGGAGVFIDTNQFAPGQNLFLHFQPGDGVPPFNAVCTIISKEFHTNPISKANEYKYGVKFTSISQNIKQKIQEFAEKEIIHRKKVS